MRVKLGFWLTSKLGRAWVGAWVMHGWWCCVVGGWDNCMCILPGLVMLDLGVGGGLDNDGDEVVGVVS